MLEFVARHVWIFFLLHVVINISITNFHFKKYGYPKPELKQNYTNSLKIFRTILVIPFLIMAIGDLTNMIYYSIDFFKIGSLNFITVTFHFYIVFMFFLSIWWIYFKNGAEFIDEHEGLISKYGYHGSGHWNSRQLKVFIIPLYLMIFYGMYIFLWIIGFKIEG